jgi:flagellar biosynthesis/type III secretory pathway protein FliH
MKNTTIIFVFTLFVGFVIGGCKQSKEQPQERKMIDATRYKENGDPVGFHRSADGVLYYDNDISAPREGETSEDFMKRTESYRSSGDNQYDEGYDDGYEAGYEAGKLDSN